MIGGGELKIDPTEMEAIMNFSLPTHVFNIRSFIGVTRYLNKFIASILMDFVGVLPTTWKGHDYPFVVVYKFIKFCVLIPVKRPSVYKKQ